MTRSVQPDIGDLVRTLRQELGLTQEKFAAKLGVTFPTVNRWENKRAIPSPLAMEKIDSMIESLSGSLPQALHERRKQLLSMNIAKEC